MTSRWPNHPNQDRAERVPLHMAEPVLVAHSRAPDEQNAIPAPIPDKRLITRICAHPTILVVAWDFGLARQINGQCTGPKVQSIETVRKIRGQIRKRVAGLAQERRSP